jgi:hypothetical protein
VSENNPLQSFFVNAARGRMVNGVETSYGKVDLDVRSAHAEDDTTLVFVDGRGMSGIIKYRRETGLLVENGLSSREGDAVEIKFDPDKARRDIEKHLCRLS